VAELHERLDQEQGVTFEHRRGVRKVPPLRR
jgi:hypothetical protein